jgi:hypothetical protein
VGSSGGAGASVSRKSVAMSMQLRGLLFLRPVFLWSRDLLFVEYRIPIPVSAKKSTAPHIHVGMPMLLFLWFVGAVAFV